MRHFPGYAHAAGFRAGASYCSLLAPSSPRAAVPPSAARCMERDRGTETQAQAGLSAYPDRARSL